MHRIDPRVHVVIATLILSAIGGCTATGNNQGQAGSAGSGGAGQGGMGAGGDGGGFVIVGAGGNGGGCVADKQQATLVKEPVDLIMVVDTSPTMGPASDSVEKTINENLATALTSENVDYRLIVLAGYGSGAELCISPPLGGAACTPTPPAQPANTSRFFHYVRATGSGALLDNIINWYNAADDIGSAPNGWKEWLRPGAKKVFLIFSDTSSSSSNAAQGDTFDANLLALDAATFGTTTDRRYTFHTIIGLRENNPATSPWLPADPLVQDTCTGFAISLAPGESLQQVSILSKGLRFPVCQFAGFDVVFQQIAKDVVQKTELACDIPFPMPPAGETIDPDTIQLVYTSGAGMKSTYGQVIGLPDCKPNSFYVEGQVIHLCPTSCDTVKVDAMGTIDVQYGCDVGFVK